MSAIASLAQSPAATLPSINGLGLGDPFARALAARFTLHRMPDAFDPRAEVLVSVGARVDDALLDRMPALRLVAVLGAGFDYVDIAALRRRGIQLANTPGLTDACVADLAMGLMIAVQRRVLAADRYVRDGKWLQGRFPLAPRFSGRRLGIFGLGRIGAAIARRALGFDLEIAYHDRARRPDLPYRHFDDLGALAAWSDNLVVACPATPETRHRVDAGVLRALGREGVLVNIARGAVIDEAALVQALEAGTIAGAGLDVFENEPQVPPRLLALDNVVLTPHLAGGTNETWDACYAGVIANIESFFRTGRPSTPVDLK
ncbi:MAG: 2-hydroxyacid dehydrogenase [Alphaproteobacteria bacterium]|nr:2-hydroxyacid dehydrogenase [Alphaproteobacteria bacterium]